MSDLMRPVPLGLLVSRSLAEYRRKGSIFDIPEEHFWRPGQNLSARIFSSAAENPVGPAAGPHTQLAQNILASWLAGGRYIELKTVQKLDALRIEKPCIDAADEGYNVEWSTELSLEGAYDEYLKAWFLLHFFDALMGPDAGGRKTTPAFLFNMSVGYDLEGIKTEKMDRFITRLIDSSGEELFNRYHDVMETITGDSSLLEGTPWKDRTPLLRALPGRISPRICGSVTLSTMHGCPPKEIESICSYLLREKKLDTLVKLNPTLLGYERVRETLSRLGYGYIELHREGFAKDLQYTDAVPMLGRLLDAGENSGKHFGVKLSNTLAAANTRGVLPGSEIYMSGRALYPLTINLAATLAADFSGRLPMSFSGGISAWNLAEVLAAGIRPVTVATDLLKPGGYGRLKELAEIAADHRASWDATRVDAEKARAAAESALEAAAYRKEFRSEARNPREYRGARVRVEGQLPLFDCFVAPCVRACPIGQDVPEYVHLAGAGKHEEAFALIHERNPLPFITAYLCDHQCTENCSRRDWEGAVQIREIKRIAAGKGYATFRSSRASTERKADPRDVKTAIIGAGPAGLAAGAFLAREGFEVHLFEREKEPGGVVRYLLPGFRLPADAVQKDVTLLRDLGVVFHFEQEKVPAVGDLKSSGFDYVLVAIGAEDDRDIGIPNARSALDFLRQFRRDPGALRLGRSVAVIGAGDTAMDAARAARRCPGVEQVRVIYRRTEREMPASEEEYRAAAEEGIEFHFLRTPEKWETGNRLVCRVMELGEPDTGGRPRSVPTEKREIFSAETVITAAGTDVDEGALEGLGFRKTVKADPATQETEIPGVFLIGDAASGAATIVKAIASARRAADAICAREGGSRYRGVAAPPEDLASLRRHRDRLRPAARPGAGDRETAETESLRCLGCGALCLKCVEVCPNRANTVVRVEGFRDEAQIVHLDALCNECGNCATFCPWDGRPYRDKLTVFDSEEDFRGSENPGFFLRGGKAVARIRGQEREMALNPREYRGAKNPREYRGALDSSENLSAAEEDRAVQAVVHAIVHDHPYLLGAPTR